MKFGSVAHFHKLIADVLDGSELNDDHISEGNQLLHSQFPNF